MPFPCEKVCMWVRVSWAWAHLSKLVCTTNRLKLGRTHPSSLILDNFRPPWANLWPYVAEGWCGRHET